jgi:hypothetical protein
MGFQRLKEVRPTSIYGRCFSRSTNLTIKSVLATCEIMERSPVPDVIAPLEFCSVRDAVVRDSWFHAPGGTHNNLPEFEDGDQKPIPAGIGRWTTVLEFAREAFIPQDDLRVGCLFALSDEDNAPDTSIRDGYFTFANEAKGKIVDRIEGSIRSIAGLTPDPDSDPCGYAWEDDESQHVVFRGGIVIFTNSTSNMEAIGVLVTLQMLLMDRSRGACQTVMPGKTTKARMSSTGE